MIGLRDLRSTDVAERALHAELDNKVSQGPNDTGVSCHVDE